MKKNTPPDIVPPHCAHCLLWAMDDEDDELCIVNKAANTVVHPGYGNYDGTLVNALIYHFDNLPSLPSDYFGRPGLVHRLDKHTTGLMVVAKTENSYPPMTTSIDPFHDRMSYGLG